MRRRDLRADQRAVAITGDPEGLLLALGKVCGAASLGALAPAYSMHCFADTSRARTRRFGFVQLLRPAFGERMQRVADFAGVFDAATIRSALQKGKAYASDYAAPLSFDGGFGLPSDEVSRLKQGFVTGRVYRVLSQEDVPVYESPRPQAFVVATIQPKALVVVFDDLGGMRQVNTVDEVPGYIRRDVMLQAVTNVLPCEVYDPAIRRAVEERLSGRELGRPALPRLSRSQIWLTAAVVITVFMVVTGLLWLLGGH